jgi:hypothetical protein
MDSVEDQSIGSDQDLSATEDGGEPAESFFAKRFKSFLLDILLYACFYALLGALAARTGIADAPDWSFHVVAPLVYWVGFVALGATPACWLCNIQIVDEVGRAPGIRRALLRSLLPGTVWVLIAIGAFLFDPRIDALYEAHPLIEDSLFWGGALALIVYFWIYLSESQEGDHAQLLHDVIAGTRVVPHQSAKRATISRRFGEFEQLLSRWNDANFPERVSRPVQKLLARRRRNGCRES